MFLVVAFISVSTISLTDAKKSPTAKCRDGTYSYSNSHRGTCSHHKGVKTWYK